MLFMVCSLDNVMESIFDEMVYIDGGNKSHSWAEKVMDAGQLTYMMKDMIMQFS